MASQGTRNRQRSLIERLLKIKPGSSRARLLRCFDYGLRLVRMPSAPSSTIRPPTTPPVIGRPVLASVTPPPADAVAPDTPPLAAAPVWADPPVAVCPLT